MGGLVAGFVGTGILAQFAGFGVRKAILGQDVTPFRMKYENNGVNMQNYMLLGVDTSEERFKYAVLRFPNELVSDVKEGNEMGGPWEFYTAIAGAVGGCVGANLLF